MSTIGYENWAVDLAEVGAIYPFQGWEVFMTVLGVALWIGWHVKQFRSESRELEEARTSLNADTVSISIERY
ncbi:MAG: hypothetical protein ACPG5U_03505 [Planktomarina sp.]